MAAYIALKRLERREKVRRDPLEMKDLELISEYRMPKSVIMDLCNLLYEDLKPTSTSKRCLTVEQQVLISLKLLASGSFQNSAKDNINVSQPTVSVVLGRFLDSLISKHKQFIKMPDRDSSRLTKQQFYAMASFPGVLGAIDGTHIPIIAPSEEEHLFVNRKGFHSINVQAVCDSNMVFLDVVCKWPGSCHDAYILRQSNLFERFESGEFHNDIILGDSGYPLKPWLMTPITHPRTPSEQKYNKAHKHTRSIVEKAFGVLKQRWRVIDHTGGRLCYSPLKVCKITMCCFILHNICRLQNVPLLQPLNVFADVEPLLASTAGTESDLQGSTVRDSIVTSFQ